MILKFISLSGCLTFDLQGLEMNAFVLKKPEKLGDSYFLLDFWGPVALLWGLGYRFL